MSGKIDHIMTITADIDRTAAAMHDLGFRLTPPSRHEAGAWTNRNINFENGYWELLQVHRATPQTAPLRNAMRQRRGLHGICLASQDIEASAARASHAGLLMSNPSEFSRTVKVNGQSLVLRFRMAHCLDAPEGLLLFFCQRIADRQGLLDALPHHANHAASLASLVLHTAQPDQCGSYLARLFDTELQIHGGGYRLPLPGHSIDVLPARPANSDSCGPDAINAIVRLRCNSGFQGALSRPVRIGPDGVLIEFLA